MGSPMTGQTLLLGSLAKTTRTCGWVAQRCVNSYSRSDEPLREVEHTLCLAVSQNSGTPLVELPAQQNMLGLLPWRLTYFGIPKKTKVSFWDHFAGPNLLPSSFAHCTANEGLPEMPTAQLTSAAAVGRGAEELLRKATMRCGGCGAKVGASTLTQVGKCVGCVFVFLVGGSHLEKMYFIEC